MSLVLHLCVLATVVLFASPKTLPLPSYLKTCSRNDPNLNVCAAKSAQDALSRILKGDRKYKVPALNPQVITKLDIVTGNGSLPLNLILTNVEVHGYKEVTFRSVKFDLAKTMISINMFTPNLQLIGDYEVAGKILILPITGNGPINITYDNMDMTFDLKFNLVKKSDGLEYIDPYECVMSYTTKKIYFKLDNLFNGDKALSDNMNLFLNDNWELVAKEVGPSFVEAFAELFLQVFKGFISTIPYDEVFPLK